MKFILLILAIVSLRGQATTHANCRLVDGLYTNSLTKLDDLRFETIVDVFTLRNSNSISLELDSERLRFIRAEMTIDRHTKLTYFMKDSGQVVRGAYVTIDRTPRAVASDREFYGNIILSPKLNGEGNIITKDSLNYNFYCSF